MAIKNDLNLESNEVYEYIKNNYKNNYSYIDYSASIKLQKLKVFASKNIKSLKKYNSKLYKSTPISLIPIEYLKKLMIMKKAELSQPFTYNGQVHILEFLYRKNPEEIKQHKVLKVKYKLYYLKKYRNINNSLVKRFIYNYGKSIVNKNEVKDLEKSNPRFFRDTNTIYRNHSWAEDNTKIKL